MRFWVVYSRDACRWMGDILGEALADCLRNLGIPAQATLGPPMEPRRATTSDHFIIMGLESIGHMGQGWPRVGTVFLYNAAETDEHHTFWRAWRRRLARNYEHTNIRLDAVLDYSKRNRENLRHLGFEKVDVPVGYHPFFEFPQERRFDWTFIGRVHPDSRRHAMLEPLCRKFPNHFVQARGTKNYWAMTREGICLQGYQSNVTLQIQRAPNGSNFAGCRVIMMAMSNRQAIVNERSSWWPDCLEHGVDWMNVDTGKVVTETKKLIRDKERAEEMGLHGYETIKKHYRLRDHLERGLKEFGYL